MMRDLAPATACLWLALLTAAGHLGAAEYYVDRDSLGGSCDDSNPGRETDPWCTLDKANSTVQPGDTVIIREGTYDERIVPSLSGEDGRPIVYRAYVGETAVVSGRWGHSATLDGTSYVTIEGITFDGGLNTATGIYIDNHGDFITIRNCTIRNFRDPDNTGGMGIWVARGGASHLLIEACTIFNNGTDNPDLQNGSNIHIFSESDNITVRGCDIYESATEDGLHLGAFGLVTDVLVENCRFWGNKEDGIDMKLVERVTVRGCEFWGHSETSTGGGAGIVIHMGARDVVVDRCISHDNDDGFAVAYNNDGTARSTERITIQRSVMYGNRDFAVHVAGGYWGGPMEGMLREIYLHNNTIYENGYGVFLYAHPDGDVQTVELFNNVLWANADYDFGVHSDRIEMLTTDYNDYPGGETGAVINWHGSALTLGEFQSASGLEAASLAVDPHFNDAAAQDFTLMETSPVIDRGTDVGLPFNGAAPDMGAYEYGVPVVPDEDVPDGIDPDPLSEEAAPEPAEWLEPQDASSDSEPPPDSGSDADPQEPGSEGCGCRMASSPERLPSPVPLLLLLVLLPLFRRSGGAVLAASILSVLLLAPGCRHDQPQPAAPVTGAPPPTSEPEAPPPPLNATAAYELSVPFGPCGTILKTYKCIDDACTEQSRCKDTGSDLGEPVEMTPADFEAVVHVESRLAQSQVAYEQVDVATVQQAPEGTTACYQTPEKASTFCGNDDGIVTYSAFDGYKLSPPKMDANRSMVLMSYEAD